MSVFLNRAKERINQILEYKRRGPRERNRFYLLIISVVLIMDYLFICFHTGRNPLNVFPSIPAIDERKSVVVYLPSLDGKTLLKENRMMVKNASNDKLVSSLFKFIVKGSMFENTSETIPIKPVIRKIWFNGDECIIDIKLAYADKSAKIIEGSEQNFRDAVSKTITENIPSIKKVNIVQKGLYNRSIW